MEYKPIYDLTNPGARKKQFPDKDYHFLLFCIRNMIVAFRIIHERKIIVGDVNESNLMVSDKGLVKFIDCDSFQISNNNRNYACAVGVASYTAPELHAVNFGSVLRKESHDIFGLAVLCFQLLFMGRHPFIGIDKGPEIPFEKWIEQFRFAYGRIGQAKGLKPPDGAVRFDSLPPSLQSLFEQTFSEQGVALRPGLALWYKEVDNFIKQLKICSKDKVHKFYNSLIDCPWCALEESKGLYFFIKSKIDVGFDAFNLNEVWTRIQKTILPADDLSIHAKSFSLRPNHGKGNLKVLSIISNLQKIIAWSIPILMIIYFSARAFVISIPLSLGLYSIPFIRTKIKREELAYRQMLNEKNVDFQHQLKSWACEDSKEKFAKLKTDLEALAKRYQRLANDYAMEKKRLYDNREFHQLQQFLGGFYLRNNSIPYIKEARKITLRSFGVESAADISGMVVPGFGPFLTGELMAWRRSLEKKFKFNPGLGLDQEQLGILNQKFTKLKTVQEKELLTGAEQMAHLHNLISTTRRNLRERVIQAGKDYYQSEINYRDLF